MNFTQPWFLWAFLSLLPLFAIYLLKIRPTRKSTTAFFLWEEIFQEKKASSLFQRFRDLFSLLLMAVTFSAIVFAMTQPYFGEADKRDLVLLIDNSASMNATQGNETRFEKATRTARDIVRALNGNQRCSIAVTSDTTTFVSSLSRNPKELLDAINRVQQTPLPSMPGALKEFGAQDVQGDLAGDPEKELDTLSNSSNAIDNKQHRVVLITDGCLPKFNADIEVLNVCEGEQTPGNVGIVACDMQRLPGNMSRVGFFYQIESTFEETIEAEIVLSQGSDEKIVKIIPVELVTGLNPPEVFELDNAQPGKWELRIETDSKEDALGLDNVAYMHLPKRKPIQVAVDAEDRFFYENSIAAFSGTGGILELSPTNSDQSKLVIGQGQFTAGENSTADILVFSPKGNSKWWAEIGEEIVVTVPRALDDSHPVIRHLDVSAISFAGACRLTPPRGAEVWVVAEDDTPLIYRTTQSGRTAIVVNLDPLDSDFYFSAWFPILVYSSATHLAGRTETQRGSFATGEMASIPGRSENAPSCQVTWPDNSQHQVENASLGPLKQTGFYELKNSNGSWIIASSLLSAVETRLAGQESLSEMAAIDRGLSLPAWLTFLAVLVVCLESVLYQRRKVG